MAFKNGHYIPSGRSLEEIEERIKKDREEDAKLKSWDDVPPMTEDQDTDDDE